MRPWLLAAALALFALVLVADPALAQRRARNANLPPPGPAPRSAAGRVLLGGTTPADKGVWTPQFGVTDPIAPVETVPFQPWSSRWDLRWVGGEELPVHFCQDNRS